MIVEMRAKTTFKRYGAEFPEGRVWPCEESEAQILEQQDLAERTGNVIEGPKQGPPFEAVSPSPGKVEEAKVEEAKVEEAPAAPPQPPPQPPSEAEPPQPSPEAPPQPPSASEAPPSPGSEPTPE